MRSVLAEEGVDTSLLFVDPAGTARSVNLVRPDGGRTFFGDSLASGFLDGLLFAGQSPVDSVVRGQVLARITASAVGGAARFDRASLEGLVSSLVAG